MLFCNITDRESFLISTDMNPYFTEYGEYLQRLFPGGKVQKLSVNAGFRCPNRDGSIGVGGCIYCRNEAFSPAYCHGGSSVSNQIESGKHFFSRKYPTMRYLAYFQNYTNTYGSTAELKALYEEALSCSDVVGLIVGTRPDCLDADTLRLLSDINRRRKVIIEFGAESSHDKTLQLINRGHTWQCTVDAVNAAAKAGLSCGLHLIMGLPGESIEDMLTTTQRVSQLPIDTVKFHHLQVLKDTRLKQLIGQSAIDYKPFEIDEYVDLCAQIVRLIPRRIAIERFLAQSPPELVAAPHWGLKNYQFMHLLLHRLDEITMNNNH
jgi:hypothetical protein